MKIYKIGDYLATFECQVCGATDKLFYTDCPCCGDDFIECNSCGKKWSQEECTAVTNENI